MADIRKENSDTVVEGYVTRTDPEIGTEVPDQSTVIVYISLGKEVKEIKMPSVLGYSIEDARQMLISGGFSIKEVKQVESSSPKGVVVSQSIPADAMVEEKSEVTLEVSIGMNTSKDILVNLPLTPFEFTLKIYVNGVEQYSGVHKASEGSVTIPVKGSGSSLVEVFVDSRLHASDIINFN
ncbi:hypothetical protein SDC9_172535 [bioreactor metagenome]|uniref:PASTA domain-containing protein n=1 Tax=bioreactor metagenome TaxID=1076179 RepID=A0A645GE05_9ZZZZ